MQTVKEALISLQNLTNVRISQEEFGKALGTGRTNINRRIKNKSFLTLEELKKLESYFNVILLEGGVKNLALMPLLDFYFVYGYYKIVNSCVCETYRH